MSTGRETRHLADTSDDGSPDDKTAGDGSPLKRQHPNPPEELQETITRATPYRTLRQLASIASKPSTPPHRAPNIGNVSTHRSTRRTPAAQLRTPRAAQRTVGLGRTAILTPHGTAAIRELELRRSGLTPGKDRRRSGRQQRETPRDVLRALSRVLAPESQPVEPSPRIADVTRNLTFVGPEDFEDASDLEQPRLSIPIGNDDDDSLVLPPTPTGLEDDNFTAQSIELPRRVSSERQPARLSRSSFGSLRSDGVQDVSETVLADLAIDPFESSFLPNDFEEDVAMADASRRDITQNSDVTSESRRLVMASTRNSDVRPITLPTDDNDTTFQFEIPSRSILDNGPMQSSEEEEDSEPEHRDDAIEQLTVQPEDLTVSYNETSQAGNEVHHRATKKKSIKVSKHGIQYPSLPAGVVKRLATTFARVGGNSKAKINKDTLAAIVQASDWFFEQVSDDLDAYAKHAGRKTIEESDILTLMSRQRQVNSTATPFSLAQRHLPPELLQVLRVAPPSKLRHGQRLARLEEDEEED